MAEKYEGIKFSVVFQEKRLAHHPLLAELQKWGVIFSEKNLAPKVGAGSSGNLSVRSDPGFIITSTNSDLRQLQPEDFVHVISADMNKKELIVRGMKQPSSESLMHAALYSHDSSIAVVFHGHCEDILNNTSIPTTPTELPYGTPEIAQAVVDVMNTKQIVNMKNHGFVAVGTSTEKTGKLVLKTLSQSVELHR